MQKWQQRLRFYTLIGIAEFAVVDLLMIIALRITGILGILSISISLVSLATGPLYSGMAPVNWRL